MVVPESSINNIMGGLESTGGVTLHNHRRKLKQRFETIAKLGQGTYGKVQLGINKETGQEVAIKTIKKCKIETEADLIRIRREIQIMSSLRHPYIIHIYEVFENRDKMVLVMEYAAGGELYDYLSKQKVLDESEARRIFRQIAMAVYYCHKHQICHRDLKLENILLDEKGNAKIADFGLSNVFDSNRLLSTFCGSPLYASPEIVKGVPYKGPEVDCWSLGVLLYTLVYGAMPFDGSNFKRLVRQISAGEYFEPKTPSSASNLIAGLLTVKSSDRLDITAVCKHPWLAEEGKASCYLLAAELANETPNRLDLLLALAPRDVITDVTEEKTSAPVAVEKPPRSLSLSSLSTMQQQQQPILTPVHLPAALPECAQEQVVTHNESEKEVSDKGKERKRERSRSRSRRKDSEDEKPKKKSVKGKKKSEELESIPKEEIDKTLEDAKKISEIISNEEVMNEICAAPVELSKEETAQEVVAAKEETVPESEVITASASKPSVSSEEKPKEKKIKKKDSLEDEGKEQRTEVNEVVAKDEETVPKEVEKKVKPKVVEAKSTVENQISAVNERKSPELPTQQPQPPKEKELKTDIVRRRSKVFEAAEIFNKGQEKPSAVPEKPVPKKVFIPGVKVSDAKAAFERRSSVPAPAEKKPEFSLASSVNVNKLIENELQNTEADTEAETVKKEAVRKETIKKEVNKVSEPQKATTTGKQLPTPQTAEKSEFILASSVNVNKLIENELKESDKEQKLKKENAVKVISHAISESELNEKKASTLPRRKLSRPTPPRAESEHMVANTKVSQIIYPTPIPPPRPSLVKQDSAPREHIIPIKIEGRDETPATEKPPLPKQSSVQSSTSSTASMTRQDSDSSTVSAATSTTTANAPCEPIRKSAREVIIPIAVEGGGFVTPSQSTLTKMSSVSESEEDVPRRAFGLHSTRRRQQNQLEATDSLSSDEDDDNFEMLTTENLFSALFNRMRNLTHKLNAEEMRPSFPRLFNHPIFDSPSRRLSETKSFTHDDPTPWRTKRDTAGSPSSSSTLPRARVTVHVPMVVESSQFN
ncbi:hypothetical protein O3M35_001471 [Rhynocoris fuscipes]|uniref:Protein kinase domain-containing protein n=1 Tax=Rhynocoris fuscipes TaxID=488301 RepID=A0AAW1CUC1_9HEMI